MSGIKVRAGGQLSPRQKMGRSQCSFSEPSPTELQSHRQASAISETPSTLLTLFALPWRYSCETSSHPTYGPMQAAFIHEWLAGLGSCLHLPKSSQTSKSQLQ